MARPNVWLLLSTSVVLSLMGCQSKAPFFNPLAPYGSPRVEPPATGSYTAPDAYYQAPTQPSAAPAQGSTSRNDQPFPSFATGSGVQPSYAWQPSGTSAARAATGSFLKTNASLASDTSSPIGSSAQSGFNTSVGGASAIRVVENNAAVSSSALSLDRMPVNDATRNAEPRLFSPQGRVVEIGQLPTSSPSYAPTVPSVRGLSQPAAATTDAADQPRAPADSTRIMSNGWQSRVTQPAPMGVASR